MHQWQVETDSPEATFALGQRLGRLATPPLLILLRGELGAGKTLLAQGLARGLGVPAEVAVHSPTYTLLNHYAGRCPVYHFDLYRLNGADELEELGFDEFAHGDGVALVEWAERLDRTDFPHLDIALEILAGDRRRLQLTARGGADERLLRQLAAAGSME